ncbi:Eukaryotic peptide chain release factor GTP-binding subunit ERF3A [Manis javanica]|nr:Eukaryotic peptide chain release factor GTP-binding subunit ERF3A [Manis javanica]
MCNSYYYILIGLPFIPYLDNLPNFNRSVDGPIRLPIVDTYKINPIYRSIPPNLARSHGFYACPGTVGTRTKENRQCYPNNPTPSSRNMQVTLTRETCGLPKVPGPAKPWAGAEDTTEERLPPDAPTPGVF